MFAVTVHCCMTTSAPRANLLGSLVMERVEAPRKETHLSLATLLEKLDRSSQGQEPVVVMILSEGDDLASMRHHKHLFKRVHLLLVTSADLARQRLCLRPILPKALLPLSADLIALTAYLVKTIECALPAGARAR